MLSHTFFSVHYVGQLNSCYINTSEDHPYNDPVIVCIQEIWHIYQHAWAHPHSHMYVLSVFCRLYDNCTENGNHTLSAAFTPMVWVWLFSLFKVRMCVLSMGVCLLCSKNYKLKLTIAAKVLHSVKFNKLYYVIINRALEWGYCYLLPT